ncbi:MAG: hypothetical protein COV44_03980 [Deltaproteobacteria bacterium CG11_big_fil_rev_8_21_14_0_20_45_16]|nr:MAG: hypothetical protein COV44_03980 [Deltaproteobacteria bacterium CG11_big_fil_rev_8_21_14_0_20_45_16]
MGKKDSKLSKKLNIVASKGLFNDSSSMILLTSLRFKSTSLCASKMEGSIDSALLIGAEEFK